MPETASTRRVAITGLGVVSPVGLGREAFWDALAQGESGIGPLTLFDVSGLGSRMAAEVPDFRPQDILGKKGLRLLDRTTRLALCATALALDDAGLSGDDLDSRRAGVAFGSHMGGIESRYGFNAVVSRMGPRGINPAHFPATVINAPASQISIRFGIRGFNTTVSTGFTSSLEAIEYGARMLELGRADIVIAGGAEELSQFSFTGLSALGYLSPGPEGGTELCAPFDVRRNGAVLGEGGVMVVMEPLEGAWERGARVLGEYAGGAAVTDPERGGLCEVGDTGAANAIRTALERAGTDGSEVGYAAAGAASTPSGDAAEARALDAVFGAAAPPVSAVKSLVGEALGAGGGFQVGAALLALDRGVLAPTANHARTAPDCPVDCVANGPRQVAADVVLVVSAAPLGQSAACILARPGPAP